MEGTVALKCDWSRLCVGGQDPALLPSSIKSLGFWVYMQQTASTLSVNIWEEGESLSGLRLSAVLLLVALEVPTVPSVRVPVWREIWEQAAAAAWLSERNIASPQQPNSKLRWSHPDRSSPRTHCEIWSLEPLLGSTRPHFPPHVCLCMFEY